MNKVEVTLWVTLLVSVFTFVVCTNVVKIGSGADINEQRISKRESIGVVKGMRPCGGQSKPVEWRYETCSDADAICQVLTDGVLRTSQLDFIPSQDINYLGLRFIVRSTDGSINTVYDDGPITIADTVLRNGNTYTITADGGVSEELKGKNAVVQYILYGLDDEHVELCAEADFKYV